MWWLIGIVIVIAAFAFPRFGKALLVLATIVVVGILIVIANERQESAAARTRVSASEIDLLDLRLGSSYGSSYRLVGRLRNRSPRYTLSSLSIKVTMRDCTAPGQCETVGETTTSVYASVPPGQVRGIDDSVYFSGLPPFRGKMEWIYSVVEIRAK